MWFHVFEDELNHRGQIRLLRAQLPGQQARGLTGAAFGPLGEDGLGMCCGQVYKDSPADLAGLRAGDVVLEYEGRDVTNAEFYELPLFRPPGVSRRLRVQRGEEVLELELTWMERPG